MTLASGSFIGHYEILHPLGAGGMGEVYRARDTKLGRDVALKILPEIFAADAERLARFRREAMTLASLNHPNIAQIHGVEEDGPIRALVMEMVDGDDLAMRLMRGAIPLDDALPIARQIADALEAAHHVGLVHRDLKPANIKVRPDGTVKVLDFGLAKSTTAVPPSWDQARSSGVDSPTITSPAMTQVGVILGTAAYMAPEQAKAQAVDRRADVWAFGCVVFEMLTGRRCFSGDTVTDVIASVLTREPDWTALPETTPDSVRRMLRRCLQKDQKRRLHDIADARIELEDGLLTPSMPVRATGRWPTSARWMLGLCVVLVTALGVALLRVAARSDAPVAIVRAQRLTDLTGLEEAPALSPDGRSVAFSAAVNGRRQVFIQLLAGGAPLRITQDDTDHQFPRWTSDSSSVVYFSPARPGDRQGTLWEMSALGGPPRRIVDSVGGGDVSDRDSRLTFFRLADRVIQLVTAPLDVSTVNVIARFEPARYFEYPRWSPDGKWIAFQRGDSLQWDLVAVPAAGGEPRQLTKFARDILGLSWLPDSTGIVYSSSRGDSMLYLPTARLWQVALADGTVRQMTSGEQSYLQPDIAKTGTIVVSRRRLQSDIWKFPTDGTPALNVEHATRITRQTGQVLTPTPAPSDREVAFLSDSGGHANIWSVDVERGVLRQLTHERDPTVTVGVPVWSSRSDSIAFVSSRGSSPGSLGIWLINRDGSNLRSLVSPGTAPSWSPDGRAVYYSPQLNVGVCKIPADGGAVVKVRTERLRNPIGSDGKTLYYVVERALVDGLPEFEIRAATPEDGPSRLLAQISPSRVPTWQILNPTLSPDGKWIAQPLTDGFSTNVWALSTKNGEWRQLTDFGGRPTFIVRRVSWSADGRFVLAAVAEGDADIVLLDLLLKTVEPGRR